MEPREERKECDLGEKMVECMCKIIQNSGDKFHTLRLKTICFSCSRIRFPWWLRR